MFTSKHLFLDVAYKEDNVLGNPGIPNSGTRRPQVEKFKQKETTWDKLAFLTNSYRKVLIQF